MKDAQATGEAFSPQKRTSSTSKHENSVLWRHLLMKASSFMTNRQEFNLRLNNNIFILL